MKPDVFELLCDQDWDTLGRALVAHVEHRSLSYRWRHGQKAMPGGRSPMDVAQEVIAKAFAGARREVEDYRNWDPDRGELLPWLKRQADSIIDKLAKSAPHRREARFADEEEDEDDKRANTPSEANATYDVPVTPEDDALRREEIDWAKEQTERLIEMAEQDDEVIEIITAILDGHGPEPRFLAERLSTSVDDVNKRMKRLRRHARKVMEQ